MDTLTRMRAFIDVVEAEGFSAAGRKIGCLKALLSKYASWNWKMSLALLPQPDNTAVLTHRSQARLFFSALQNWSARSTALRIQCAKALATSAAASSFRQPAVFADRAHRPIIDRLCRGPSRHRPRHPP